MWKQIWHIPPATWEELNTWKIYCRIWVDVGLQAPGIWIMEWMQKGFEERDFNTEGFAYVHEAIRWYQIECKE